MAGRLGYRIDVFKRIKQKTIYENDHWLFTGKKTGIGHGGIWYNGQMRMLCRVVLAIKNNLDLDDSSWTANHKDDLCSYPNCWNPDHLYVGTPRQNVADSIRKGTFHYGTKNLNFRGNYLWKRIKKNADVQ